MTKLDRIRAWWEEQLPALLDEYEVPGAAVAVDLGGEVADHGAGVLSLSTGVEANAETLFQIGSITKVWTATLVMQLVDEGLVELDAPIRGRLPEFRIADESAAAAITVRQLLNHTAGFEGDIFTDTGKDDDCVEKYVAGLGDVPQLFAPGELFSYNNAGYCVLGRLVEVVRGKPYGACLRDHLFTPLGLTHAAHGADEAILYRAAVGHLPPSPGEPLQPAPVWNIAPSNSPAGSLLAMRPRDLLAFARMHLNDGTADNGNVVLSEATAKAMREREVELPRLGVMGDAWGLGWEIFDGEDTGLIGHDGSTIGQSAFMRLVPEHDLAIALLTNGGNTLGLYHAVVGHLLRELADVDLPAMPVPPADPQPVDAGRFLGTYSSRMFDNTVTQDDDRRVWVTCVPKGLAADMGMETTTVELVAFDGDTLIAKEEEHGFHQPYAFVGRTPDGPAQFLHTGRADRRTAQ
ncbi:beta-lactamase family protein [Streptomyces spinosirectus]|uniref:serine hydrolase domain-containing protein n=1 Tax=Streptomyces TaxID=1883 RepID=UPI001C9DDD3E|nr:MULTISPECIES: serine hydrolase domain-containing protein [Streptomyces]MBY8343406.1 beta-lactamase family protein [Streptomyces plumbidurans]UIR22596.1 beta-lactamase family protein [Streptomyces spinosirectus]